MNIQELRSKLGLKRGQLLTNSDGQLADLLDVKGDKAILGILSQRNPIEVPIKNLIKGA